MAEPEDHELILPESGGWSTRADGLRKRFWRRGDRIVSEHTIPDAYHGPPGIAHGGNEATVFDENGCAPAAGAFVWVFFTAEVTRRYEYPLPFEPPRHAEARVTSTASRMFLVLPKEPHSHGNGIAVSASPMPTPPMISTHRQKPAASACSGLSATATPSTLSYERYGRSRSTGGRLGDHDQRSVTGRGHALPSSTSCSTMRGRGSEVRDGTW